MNFQLKIPTSIQISLIITLVYALITIVLLANHEPFVDEINVYMVLMNTYGAELFSNRLKGGNPFGFFILLFPFVKLGASFFFIRIFCWIFSVAAIFLLNAFSPFPLFLNLIITFSAPMLYIYPVITRCYTLLPFLLIVFAELYCRVHKKQKPKHYTFWVIFYALVIGAIAQNHVIMFGFAGMMFLLFVYHHFYKERDFSAKNKISALLMALPLAAIVIQCWITLNASVHYKESLTITFASIKRVLSLFFACFFDCTKGDMFINGDVLHNNLFNFVGIILAIALFVAIIIFFFKRSKTIGLTALIATVFPWLIYIKNYSVMFPNRIFTVHLIFMALMWIILKRYDLTKIQKNTGIVLLSLLFLITMPSGIKTALQDYKNYFSAAECLASYIKKNVPNTAENIIISNAQFLGTQIAFYLDDRPVYTLDGKIIKYIQNNKIENKLVESGILKGKKRMFIFGLPWQKPYFHNLGYTFVYETPKAMLPFEQFVLFSKP